jgi:phenylalanyl-tRNA synthetase alpha chain
MSLRVEEIAEDTKSALTAIAQAKDLAQLKIVKAEHLSEKSPLARASQALGKIAAEERAEFGKVIGPLTRVMPFLRARTIQSF